MALAIIILAPIAAVCVFIVRFNPNAYVPEIIASVKKTTGRTLTFNGPVHLQLSLTPVVVASNITLSNPDGFADPALLTLAQVQARVALLPLLHHQLDILELKLVQPKLYLERDTTGQADWIFVRQQPGKPANETAGTKASSPPTYNVALKSVSLEDGQIIFQSRKADQPLIMHMASFTGQATSLDAALHVAGFATIGTTPLTLQGVVGPVSGLAQTDSRPWPVDLTFGFAGAIATLQGEVKQPRTISGYDLRVAAQIPALTAMAAALPSAWLHGAKLPALQDVKASLTLRDQAGMPPILSDIKITAGASDLSGLWPGLHLASLVVSLPEIEGAGTLNLNGTINSLPLLAQAHWTGLDELLPPGMHPADIDNSSVSGGLTVSLGNATASLNGGIATPQTLSGAALAMALNIPDLSGLSPAWGAPLPAWKMILVKTTLTDSGGQGLLKAIRLDNLSVTMNNASFGGQAGLTFGAIPDLNLNVAIATANLDALRAAMPSVKPPPLSAQPIAQSRQASPPHALAFGFLRRINANITISADKLVYDQANYAALRAHAVLKNGLLRIAPLTGQLPGGAVSASGSLDANVEPAAETLKLDAPALALGPFLRAFGLLDTAQGIVQVQVNASARGDTLATMLGSVSGQLGLASVNSEIDGQTIQKLLGNALQAAGLPTSLVGAPGPVPVRCAALRLDAENGSGTIRALGFDSSRLLLVGGGTVNFASQTLAMVLKPHMRVGGTNIVIPIEISGTFQDPHYGLASAAEVATAQRNTVGWADNPVQQFLGNNSFLGRVAGALTGDNHPDVCTDALTLARMGQAGPAPHALAQETSTPGQTGSEPRSLLNMLLNK